MPDRNRRFRFPTCLSRSEPTATANLPTPADSPLPSETEARHLANRAYFGSLAARDELVAKHTPYAIRYARLVWGRCFPYLTDDIVGASLVGLVRASGSLKPESTHYFLKWLRWHIGREVRPVVFSGKTPVQIPAEFTKYPFASWGKVTSWKKDSRGNKRTSDHSLKAAMAANSAKQVPVADLDWQVEHSHGQADARIDANAILALLPPNERDLVTAIYGIGCVAQTGVEIARRRGVRVAMVNINRQQAEYHLMLALGIKPDPQPPKQITAKPFYRFRRTASGFVPVGAPSP